MSPDTTEGNKDQPPPADPDHDTPGQSRWRVKIFILLLVFAVFGLLYLQFGEFLSLNALAERESALREFGSDHPWLIVGLAFLVYVTVTAFPIPVAAGFSMAIAWLCKLIFGDWTGFLIALVVVSFASTAGATLAFLISRYLLRDTIQRKFGNRLRTFNDALQREGAFYLFTLRLIPAVPFFVLNAVMGLTPLRTGTYWWVSQLGMLPGTAVYVYAGAQIPSLRVLAQKGAAGVMNPEILIAFALLGLFPLVVRKIISRVRPSAPNSTS